MRASVIFAPHFVHGASIRRSRNKVGAGGEAGMNALQTKCGATKKYMLVEIEELIWVNVSARRTQSLRSCPMSELGQKRHFGSRPVTSVYPNKQTSSESVRSSQTCQRRKLALAVVRSLAAAIPGSDSRSKRHSIGLAQRCCAPVEVKFVDGSRLSAPSSI